MSKAFSISVHIPLLNKVRTIYCNGYKTDPNSTAEDYVLYLLKTYYSTDYLSLLLVDDNLACLSPCIQDCKLLAPFHSSPYREYNTIDVILDSKFERQENNYYYYSNKWVRVE
jgi:hypothetical protein